MKRSPDWGDYYFKGFRVLVETNFYWKGLEIYWRDYLRGFRVFALKDFSSEFVKYITYYYPQTMMRPKLWSDINFLSSVWYFDKFCAGYIEAQKTSSLVCVGLYGTYNNNS